MHSATPQLGGALVPSEICFAPIQPSIQYYNVLYSPIYTVGNVVSVIGLNVETNGRPLMTMLVGFMGLWFNN